MCLQVNAVFTFAIILIANCWGATIKPASVEYQPKTDERLKAELETSIVSDCITPDLTVEDIMPVYQGNSTQPGKCALACIFKKFDVLTDNNTINFEAAKKLAKFFFDLYDAISQENLFVCSDDEILRKCTDITNEDECEAASKFIHCTYSACRTSEEASSEEKVASSPPEK